MSNALDGLIGLIDRDDAGVYMRKVYNYMTIGLGISGLTAWLVSVTPVLYNMIFNTPLVWIVMFAPLVMILFFYGKLVNASPTGAQMWFWIFATLEGLMLSTLAVHYTGESIVRVFFITSAMFAGLSIFGYTTKRDMSGWGKFLFMVLIGLIVAMVANIFIAGAGFGMLISAGAVLLFSALIAYDTQRIKNDYLLYGESGNAAIQGALSLYLNFLNVFIHLLNLMGMGVGDD